jgi:hypothetical protein
MKAGVAQRVACARVVVVTRGWPTIELHSGLTLGGQQSGERLRDATRHSDRLWRTRARRRSPRRWVKTAAGVDQAPDVVQEGVSSGAVTLDQAEVIVAALQRLPAQLGPDPRSSSSI